jgi:HPt (histidine-containing phosphotransfer) domain-containing protein
MTRTQTRDEVFDIDGTLKRLGGDTALLGDLAQLFEEDSPKWLAKIADAVKAEQAPQVRHASHALRGLAANFGAEKLTTTLFALESQAAADDLKQAPKLLEDVQRETAQLREALTPHRTSA